MGKLLTPAELEWVRLQPLLLERGYKLRRRYQPSWKPSWTKPWNFYKYETECEDWFQLKTRNVIDAVRIKDGAKVAIKKTIFEYDNIPLLQHLNSDERRADPRNNAVPLLEVIPVPQPDDDSDSDHIMLLVMPRLAPDACMLNFMMDPTDVIPGGFHHSRQYLKPNGKTRIRVRDRCKVPSLKYYIIDFETAEYFMPNSLCIGHYGQEKEAPELSTTVPFDPFKLDIYQLGKLVHKLMQEFDGLELLCPLRDAMTHKEPKLRTDISQALRMLHNIVSSLEETDLSRVIQKRDISEELLNECKAELARKLAAPQLGWVHPRRKLPQQMMAPQRESVPPKQEPISRDHPSSGRRFSYICKRSFAKFTKSENAFIFSL
ncbi:hypothetical protein JR316_0008912 [Psilocybe cubensis]|uniref:Uncharacterized protein n=1 Tax=Psilocybe cubensis TaxID=181762 RepID=A0ACB8GSQ3_PSICU|nr:hypothetical protein JR316_0008912 [Psilocybe cubensis]KAH9478457.1 hypothetical protein JR316_0008912 [Psilocybe cubensis]